MRGLIPCKLCGGHLLDTHRNPEDQDQKYVRCITCGKTEIYSEWQKLPEPPKPDQVLHYCYSSPNFLLKSCQDAYKQGYKLVSVYFCNDDDTHHAWLVLKD